MEASDYYGDGWCSYFCVFITIATRCFHLNLNLNLIGSDSCCLFDFVLNTVLTASITLSCITHSFKWKHQMTRIPQESIWGAENTRQAVNIIPTFVMKATTLLKNSWCNSGGLSHLNKYISQTPAHYQHLTAAATYFTEASFQTWIMSLNCRG